MYLRFHEKFHEYYFYIKPERNSISVYLLNITIISKFSFNLASHNAKIEISSSETIISLLFKRFIKKGRLLCSNRFHTFECRDIRDDRFTGKGGRRFDRML